MAVVTAVGAEAGVELSDLKPPLYEVVDPDALDTLFQDTTGTVSFEYHGSVVSVDHTNAVTLASTDDGDTHPTDSTSADDDPRAQRP
ncbi:HalOD1 output domain-containing protein [Halobaculum limi]|uniref:HalOD1 output domain-containing protein n=1 Tax=Halobaculum limi TaxID=3031916 RepID=UPI0024066054|nr:HalOD1 output domain-containing protein [Halobaculum sp. YSMS11]